ncbi:6838_t:CDS:2 [Gigaspora margarita]|uniref:6838_t:CDS:1 n=1 Tax=Gigaspora margarita TaxID=4874 RepID=A0ABM8VZR0_GIGMA|nr:6838_t:CDS:2 [Gigaspora margarita]
MSFGQFGEKRIDIVIALKDVLAPHKAVFSHRMRLTRVNLSCVNSLIHNSSYGFSFEDKFD